MNKRIRIIYYLFVSLITAIFFVRCGPSPRPTGKLILDHVVDVYIKFSELKLKQVDSRILALSMGDTVEIYYDNADYKVEKEFKKRQGIYNDKGWNKQQVVTYGLGRKVIMSACDFVSVNVYADTKYDANHNAKESLNDIVEFMSASPYKFIRSRFSKCYNIGDDVSAMYNSLFADDLKWAAREYYASYIYDTFGATSSVFYPIEKRVDKLLHEDLILLSLPKKGSLAYLYFVQPPDNLGKYDITIEMIGTDGITYKATTTMTFE